MYIGQLVVSWFFLYLYNIPFPKLKNHIFPNLVYAHMLDLVQCGLSIVAYTRFGSFKELRKNNRDLINYGCTKIKMWVYWQNINFINLLHLLFFFFFFFPFSFFLFHVLCLFFLFSVWRTLETNMSNILNLQL